MPGVFKEWTVLPHSSHGDIITKDPAQVLRGLAKSLAG
jgi:hypothetical protein